MKPNDQAYQAALRATSDSCSAYQIQNALDAAYAAQFPPSEDYAGLITELRMGWATKEKNNRAADAIEAVLAERDTYKNWLDNYEKQFAAKVEELVTVRLERDALKADLASARDRTWFWEIVDANGLNNVASSEKDALRKLVRDSAILDGLRARFGNIGEGDGQFTVESTFQALLNVIDFNVELTGKLTAAEEERDALLARLAPVDDEALVEIVAKEMQSAELAYMPAAVIAAIRPHIEAVERERCAKAVITVAKKINVAPHERPAYEDGYLQGVHDAAAAIRSGK